jgi:hypothetical protein
VLQRQRSIRLHQYRTRFPPIQLTVPFDPNLALAMKRGGAIGLKQLK